MHVEITSLFKSHLKNYPEEDKLKISAFIQHVQNHGLANLEGRNKSSDNVPTDDPRWLVKVKHAKKYNLWHYHIGIPTYEGEFGDKTSEYVLHYMLDEVGRKITLVYMSAHPPFELPNDEYLTLS
ncbi:hypothetical protein [Psychrobacter sp. H7-1]|uniref:hypothetical protein n=1 Tax=Psychrobacter sp. H7-1 TaxID=1569265 RepID=UPI0019180093|nr:hypothetical protein [Psychrobacter sp. H7-1]